MRQFGISTSIQSLLLQSTEFWTNEAFLGEKKKVLFAEGDSLCESALGFFQTQFFTVYFSVWRWGFFEKWLSKSSWTNHLENFVRKTKKMLFAEGESLWESAFRFFLRPFFTPFFVDTTVEDTSLESSTPIEERCYLFKEVSAWFRQFETKNMTRVKNSWVYFRNSVALGMTCH